MIDRWLSRRECGDEFGERYDGRGDKDKRMLRSFKSFFDISSVSVFLLHCAVYIRLPKGPRPGRLRFEATARFACQEPLQTTPATQGKGR